MSGTVNPHEYHVAWLKRQSLPELYKMLYGGIITQHEFEGAIGTRFQKAVSNRLNAKKQLESLVKLLDSM